MTWVDEDKRLEQLIHECQAARGCPIGDICFGNPECTCFREASNQFRAEMPNIEPKRWEERPPENEPVARVLWDLWSAKKRLNHLTYDGSWSAEHSTGAYSWYDPEDGDAFDNFGN